MLHLHRYEKTHPQCGVVKLKKQFMISQANKLADKVTFTGQFMSIILAQSNLIQA